MNEEILINPITTQVQKSIQSSKNKLLFAVPFLSSFALNLLTNGRIQTIAHKRLLTRFDETCLMAFDLPILKKLLKLGFKIRFNNEIHLKLYITDEETYVTSSNLTKGGFESNVELTIKIDSQNNKRCEDIFNENWNNATGKEVTFELLDANWSKYEILKKRTEFTTNKQKEEIFIKTNIGNIDIQAVITEIYNRREDYSKISNLVFEARPVKEEVKKKLLNGFSKEIFYVSEGSTNRRDNLFYDFTYGYESNIASTGLREAQFKAVFEDDSFNKVIEYIFPEMIGLKPWNFEDQNELYEFCNGIFDFKISQYTEALPIRLASYFYPEYFIPVFKLEHLKKVCEALGIATNAKTKGERFFAYTVFIAEKMNRLPYDNYIKSHIAYNIMYTVELHRRLNNGETYKEILSSFKQNWKRGYIEKGAEILNAVKAQPTTLH